MKKILILLAVYCVQSVNSSAQDISFVREAFTNYQVERSIRDTLENIRAVETRKELIRDFQLLDTLLALGSYQEISILQSHGLIPFFRKNGGNTYQLFLDEREIGVYKTLKVNGEIPYISKLENDSTLQISFFSVSPLQIDVLPSINGIPNDANRTAAIAGVYLKAIRERIPKVPEFVSKGFTAAKYLTMETENNINTSFKKLNYRQTFLWFLFTKYHVR